MQHQTNTQRTTVAPRRGLWGALALGLAAAVVPAEQADAGACASSRRYVSTFAAEEGSTLPADGGVLFAPVVDHSRRAPRPVGDAPSESLRKGNRALRSVRSELAPGWFVLRPARRTTGAIRAVSGSEQRGFVLGATPAEELAAPARPRLRYFAPHPVQGPRGSSMASPYNSLALDAPPPAQAFAVVVRSVVAEGSPPSSDGFALPIDSPGQTAFSFSPGGGRCQPVRPGRTMESGTEVEVFFVDVAGHASPSVTARVR